MSSVFLSAARRTTSLRRIPPLPCAGNTGVGAARPQLRLQSRFSGGRVTMRKLRHSASAVRASGAVAERAQKKAKKSFTLEPGSPDRLGPSPGPGAKSGVNFALVAEHATNVTLVVSNQQNKDVQEFQLDSSQHRTGNVWHALLEGLPRSGILYGFRVSGPDSEQDGHRWDSSRVLVDPYAPLIAGRARFGQRDDFESFQTKTGSVFRGTFDFSEDTFDWGDSYQRPNIPPQDIIVYEMGIRSFTADSSSGVGKDKEGTFNGMLEKIPHLKELGINAVELLPVLEYDELEFQRMQNPRDHMVNIWGYSHISFMAPMSRFAAAGAGASAARREFKQLVRALHDAGIEVLLDLVYNHTVEGGDDNPYTLSFRGLDNSVYYMTEQGNGAHLLNYSGCGNTVSANHPVVKQLIIDSLRMWVEEYHVDGFRFDLASCLCRDEHGTPLEAPPLIRDIAKDPVLSKVKLLAEPWDCGGLYQVGCFPNWDVWGEWNGKFRDDIRRFIKGDSGMKGAFATRIAGSADLYKVNNRKPYHSLNFVIAHDGFTLADLCTYDAKHNDANGEQNRDGSNDNFSWNCGAEGATEDGAVLALRQRQMRNLMLALLVAQGTPMVLSGDEYAQSRGGNNNYYGHDNQMTRFDWNELEKVRDSFFRFYSGLIKFRREHPLLGRAEFMAPEDVTWHEDNWTNEESRFLAFSLHDRGQGGGELYAAFNAHGYAVEVALPSAPQGQRWSRVVDTNLLPPRDFTPGGNDGVYSSYSLAPFSAVLLVAKAA